MNVVRLTHGRLSWWCPGCNCPHEVPVEPPHGWVWNESYDSPTLTPSVLFYSREKFINPDLPDEQLLRGDNRTTTPRCHTFMTNGHLEYLSDTDHELSNQTVPLGPFVSK